MSRNWKLSFALLAAIGLSSWCGPVSGEEPSQRPGASPAAAASQEEVVAGRALGYTQVAVPPAAAEATPAEAAAAAAPASEYWIGVQLEPLPELIASQLELQRGMVVVRVFDDSPAAEAEMKVHDIIVRAGGKDVKGSDDLIAAVNETKENELAIVVLRGGTETTLEVTPKKRSQRQVEVRMPQVADEVIVQKLDKLYQRNPDGEVRLFAVRPGAVLAYAPTAKFPDDLLVVIEKRGDKPAKIRVTKVQEGDDKTWEVTEDKLDELPEEFRGHVRNLIGRGQPVLQYRLPHLAAKATEQLGKAQAQARNQLGATLGEYQLQIRALPHAPGAEPAYVARPHQRVPPADGQIHSKLDAILQKLEGSEAESVQRLEKELEKLRKEVEALRQEKK